MKVKVPQSCVQEQNGRRGTVHDIEQEATSDNQIDMVNINYIGFNSKQSVIVAKLKISSNQISIIIPYKINTGSDGNIMPICIFKFSS